jgi:hypothetical protein
MLSLLAWLVLTLLFGWFSALFATAGARSLAAAA